VFADFPPPTPPAESTARRGRNKWSRRSRALPLFFPRLVDIPPALSPRRLETGAIPSSRAPMLTIAKRTNARIDDVARRRGVVRLPVRERSWMMEFQSRREKIGRCDYFQKYLGRKRG